MKRYKVQIVLAWEVDAEYAGEAMRHIDAVAAAKLADGDSFESMGSVVIEEV